ncbi:hypothetical protein ART_1739 [Arthrobacter sp. PAMC 25486]|nr:hypothetical protein ART_1739 [Arthrobacter sp. PAMC 25486]
MESDLHASYEYSTRYYGRDLPGALKFARRKSDGRAGQLRHT